MLKQDFNISRKKKQLAVLIDPDKFSDVSEVMSIVEVINRNSVDFIFVGGSIINNDLHEDTVIVLKQETKIPVVIFPGHCSQVTDKADGILLLSLASGRNPEYLIGQHVSAAFKLKQSDLKIVPTGYILVDGGNKTSVAYVSNTQPIPSDKEDLIGATAVACEQLGMKSIYLEAGSGAKNNVAKETVRSVKELIDIPLIVGGGIRVPEVALNIWNAGADVVVIGTAFEEDEELIAKFCEIKTTLN